MGELERRIEDLSREIRAYPTPIARCDLHLPALLEERSRLIERLRVREEENSAGGGCTPMGLWGNDGGIVA